MREINGTWLFALVWFLSGCGTTGYKPLPLTPISAAKTAPGSNNGFIEDSLPIKSFNIFPESVAARIDVESKATTMASQRNILALVCDGKKPRYQPVLKVDVVSTKPASGVALDLATAGKIKFHALARDYLKNHYLNDSSERFKNHQDKIQTETKNNGILRYKACIVNPDENRRCQTFSLLVPTVDSADRAKIIKQYRSISYTPSFRDDTLMERQFLGFVFPATQHVVLTPKVLSVEQIDFLSNGEITTSDFQVTTEALSSTDELSNVLSKVNFIPSSTGYNLEGGKAVHPLKSAVLNDLTVLKENFAFVLPREVIGSLVDRGIYGNVWDHHEHQEHYFGISPETKTFSAMYALKHRNYVWGQYLKHQTSLAEAAQDDGTIRYELSLDLSLFCTYATPIADLVSP